MLPSRTSQQVPFRGFPSLISRRSGSRRLTVGPVPPISKVMYFRITAFPEDK
jgi:hypothetical protein